MVMDGPQLDPREEAALIEKVLAGRRDEFRRLVLAYQGKVFSMIMRQVANNAIAEELAQESFLRAYRNLHKFRGEAKFSTWLTRIALNTTNNYFASREYRERMQREDFTKAQLKIAAPEASEKHSAEARFEKLRQCVCELPQRYREVVVLCSYENRTYQEAADILGIPSGTVASRMNKAFSLIRDKMKGRAGE